MTWHDFLSTAFVVLAWLVCGGMLAELLDVESWWAKAICLALGPVAFLPLVAILLVGYWIYETFRFIGRMWRRLRGRNQSHATAKKRRPA